MQIVLTSNQRPGGAIANCAHIFNSSGNGSINSTATWHVFQNVAIVNKLNS